MLTTRQLALLRAALLFFEEEMTPHGPELSEPYFEEPLPEPLTAAEVRQLRDALRRCVLRYARLNRTATRLRHRELFSSVEEARHGTSGPPARVAAVLIFPDRT